MRITMLLHKSVEFDSRVRREASALAAAGHDVCVVELAPVPAGRSVLDGFRRRSCLPAGWVRRRLPTALYRLVFLSAFVRAVRATAPDVVHAHDAAMLAPGLIGARLSGAALVYDSHELATGVGYRSPWWARLVAGLERFVVPRCDAVITVSDGIAEVLERRHRLTRRPAVVRNLSALSVAGPGGLRGRMGIDATVPLVLHQGAPAPDRGCELLVAAVAALPGVHLAFLGDPEPGYGERLAREVAHRGVSDRVVALASVPLGGLLAHTAEADVGVTLLQDTCENHRLALPNKLFEYVAAGVPVVASDLPEIARLVADYGIGWCAAPGDEAALADALATALSARGDPELARRLQDASAELTWTREQARLLAVYDELGGPGRPRRGRRPRVPR
jgi:glycosyltransferase involved in cell wall biosynthesis